MFICKGLWKNIVTNGYDVPNNEKQREKLKKNDKETIIIILATLDLPSTYHFVIPIVHHASTTKEAQNFLKNMFEKTLEEIQQVVEKVNNITDGDDVSKNDEKSTIDANEKVCQDLDEKSMDIDEITSKYKQTISKYTTS